MFRSAQRNTMTHLHKTIQSIIWKKPEVIAELPDLTSLRQAESNWVSG